MTSTAPHATSSRAVFTTSCHRNAHDSRETVRAKKRRRFDELEEKRAANVAKYGGSSDLERNELNRFMSTLMAHPKAVENGLIVQLLPDFTHADAVFRVGAMPRGRWLRWQHKSTSEAVETSSSSNDNVYYSFSDCLGYDDCLVVLSVKEEEEIVWAVRGSEIRVQKVRITLNWDDMTYTNSGLGGELMPLDGGGLLDVLLYEGSKAVTGSVDALPTCSMEDAEEELGCSHLVERRGISDWAQCMHGGFLPFDEMPIEMQNDSRVLRLTRDGTVVQYPCEQGSKVDLHVLSNWQSKNSEKANLQFKTAQQQGSGYRMDLMTHNLGDQKKMVGNVFKRGDNTQYIAMLPSTLATFSIEHEIHIWEITDAEMAAHGLLASSSGDFGLSCASLYRSDRANCATKYGWTEKCHLSFAVDGATTTPTNDAAREALANITAQLLRSKASKEEAITKATTEVRKMRARAKDADEAVSTALAAAIEAMTLVAAAEQTLRALKEAE